MGARGQRLRVSWEGGLGSLLKRAIPLEGPSDEFCHDFESLIRS